MARTVDEWDPKNDDAAIPTRVRDRILRRQSDTCAGAGCSKVFGPKVRAEFDHIVPLILGGAHAEKNLQALCPACHAAKSRVDVAVKAKVASVRAKHFGLKPPSRRPLPGGRNSPVKFKVGGGRVPRNEA